MIVPYLYFNGNAREAITFYADAFKVEMPEIMRLGDMPPDPANPLPEEAGDLVMHAALQVADSVIMFSDSFGQTVNMDGNISMMLTLKDEDKLRSYWNALTIDGKVDMELTQTFWAPLFGSLTDKFGVAWQFGLDA